MNRERNWNIDLLRICACFMVVLLHVSSQSFYSFKPISFQWQSLHFYNNLVRSAVPLFFMISGMLFLSKTKKPSLALLFKKNIFKIIFLYFLWCLFYAIDFAFIQEVNANEFLDTIYYYMIHPKYHLWYMPALVSVYFLIPLLWCVAHYEDGYYVGYACMMFFLFGILKNTLGLFPIEDSLFEYLINRFSYHLSSYSGYFLLGYYLKMKKDLIRKIPYFVYVISFCLVIYITYVIGLKYSIHINEPTTFLYDNLMLPSCIEGIIIFSFFLKLPVLRLSNKMKTVILKLSKYTLFVYLFHVFVMQHFNLDYHITGLSYYPMFFIPLFSFIIFMICMVVAFIIDFIPGLRNLIM